MSQIAENNTSSIGKWWQRIQNNMKEIAGILLLVGLLVFICFIAILWCNGYRITSSIDMATTGQIGDFIGGVVGTIWSLSSILFIYGTFQQQNRIIERDNDKFLFEVLQKKYFNKITKLNSLCFGNSFESSYFEIYSYIEFNKSIKHSVCLANLTDLFSNNNDLKISINSFLENVEKINDKFIKQVLKDSLCDILKIDNKLPNIELIISYLNTLNESFNIQTQNSTHRAFTFEGEFLLNLESNPYSLIISQLNQLKEAISKL